MAEKKQDRWLEYIILHDRPTTLVQLLTRYIVTRLHVFAVRYADNDNRIGLWLARWTYQKLCSEQKGE